VFIFGQWGCPLADDIKKTTGLYLKSEKILLKFN